MNKDIKTDLEALIRTTEILASTNLTFSYKVTQKGYDAIFERYKPQVTEHGMKVLWLDTQAEYMRENK